MTLFILLAGNYLDTWFLKRLGFQSLESVKSICGFDAVLFRLLSHPSYYIHSIEEVNGNPKN